MVEYGIVKFFDERDGKKFGFLQPCDANGNKTGEKDVFFHFNDRAKPQIRDGQLVLVSVAGQAFMYPQKGALIAFERTSARQGDKAAPWTWATNWQDAESRFASGNPANEDLPRRDWDDLAWCHSCNRDTAFCLCICYVCDEDLADCQCVCALCGVKLPGGGLCRTDFKSWNESTQGPAPEVSSHIGNCTSCRQTFNKVFDIRRERAAGGMKTIGIMSHHNRTTCPRCAALISTV